jgi:hypothetical protein
MPVVALFQRNGDTEHLLATYDRELQHPVPREQPRRIAHTCVGTDDGMVIVDVWESEEDLRAMLGDPEFSGTSATRAPRNPTARTSGRCTPQFPRPTKSTRPDFRTGRALGELCLRHAQLAELADDSAQSRISKFAVYFAES